MFSEIGAQLTLVFMVGSFEELLWVEGILIHSSEGWSSCWIYFEPS